MYNRPHFRLYTNAASMQDLQEGKIKPYEIAYIQNSRRKAIIHMEDIIEYTYTDRDTPETSELEITIKNIPEIQQFIPTLDNKEPADSKPLIIAYFENNENLWFSFITKREVFQGTDETFVTLKGYDFEYFNQYHIVPSTAGPFTDHDDLPATYNAVRMTGKPQRLFERLFERTWTDPYAILNGGKPNTTKDPSRKFAGLREYTASVTDDKSYQFAGTQENLKDTLDKLYTQIAKNPKFTQELIDARTGERITAESERAWLEIKHEDTIELSDEILQRRAQIRETLFSINDTINAAYGTGNVQHIRKESERKAWEFTSNEKVEDLSFIAGDNPEYLITPTRTTLRDASKDRYETFLKIESRDVFREINTNNIIKMNGIRYQIKQIQVMQSADAHTVDIDIEEVNEDGNSN